MVSGGGGVGGGEEHGEQRKEPGSTLVHELAFWSLFPDGGTPSSVIMQGEGYWSCRDLM